MPNSAWLPLSRAMACGRRRRRRCSATACLATALENARDVTDEAGGAVEALGLVRNWCRRRDQPEGDVSGRLGRHDSDGTQMNFRIGQGYDVHKLVEGRKLILGGVDIPHATGLLGHSDADALLHAITDALLGAVALGDIGRHFPDTDPRWGCRQPRLVARCRRAFAGRKGLATENVDATLIAQQPKLAPHAAAMVANGGRRNWRGCGEYQGQDQRTAGLPRREEPSKLAGRRAGGTCRLSTGRKFPNGRPRPASFALGPADEAPDWPSWHAGSPRNGAGDRRGRKPSI